MSGTDDGAVYTASDGEQYIYLSGSGKYYKQITVEPMWLLSEYGLKKMNVNNVTWRQSNIWDWLNNEKDETSLYKNSLNDDEKRYILRTSKSGTVYGPSDELKGDVFFSLSWSEVMYGSDFLPMTKLSAKMLNENGGAVYWWLRTAYTESMMYAISDSREVFTLDLSDDCAVRPACNLNPESILFTSAANGGKSTDISGTLREIGENTSGEYKLTMKDGSRNFSVDTESEVSVEKTRENGGKISFRYENAVPGANEYISAIIAKDGEALYYGQIANVNSAEGDAELKLPSGIDAGKYDLMLFNEHINVGNAADFSSDFTKVTLNVTKATPTAADFSVTLPADLTYNGNPKIVTVTSGKIETDDILVKYYTESGIQVTPAPKNAGTYTVKISVVASDYYWGAKELTDSNWTFTIDRRRMSNLNTNIGLGESLTYNGTLQKQKVSIVAVDGIPLMPNDYTVSDNEAKDAGIYTLKITGRGNVEGTASKTFSIAQAGSTTTLTADLNAAYGDTIELKAEVERTGARLLNKVDFYLGEGDDAVWLGMKNVSYMLDSLGDASISVEIKSKDWKIGENKITAQYGGSLNLNGSGSNTVTVNVTPKEIGLSWAEYKDLKYDGNPKNVTATATGTIGDDAITVEVTGGDKTNAGTYTATATGLTGTYAQYYKLPEALEAVEMPYTISQATDNEITNLSISDWTYGGTPGEATATSKYGTVTFAYSDKEDGTYTSTVPTDAGTYWVKATVAETEDWTEVSETKQFTVAKANSSVITPPTKAENLVYTGEKLALIAADGVAEGGIIKYSVDGENFDFDFANLPKVVEANDNYEVYYKVIGDKNHNDTEAACVKVSVAKKPIDNSVAITAPVRKGKPQTELDAETYTAAIAWSPDVEDEFAARTEYTATVTITPKSNYTVDGVTEFEADGAESAALKSNDGTTAIIEAVFPKTKSGTSVSAGTVVGGSENKDNNTSKTDNKKDDISKNDDATKSDDAVKTDDTIKSDDATKTDDTAKSDDTTKTDDTSKADDKKDNGNGGSNGGGGNGGGTGGISGITSAGQNPASGGRENPYSDVAESDWFYEYVKYADVNGLMNGTDGGNFAPNENITRGMFVTVLYRAEGEPTVNRSIPFADVSADKYYANAVIWAQQNGIVKGYSETEFAPDDFITREQIAAIIHRYAKYKGYDVSVGESTNILSYDDFDEISEYAVEAVQYAVGSGLITGKTETTLNPKDNATRAEIAAILQRFIEGNK